MGTAEAAPPPFRLGDPALCESHPLVTFDIVDWVFWPVKLSPRWPNLYCVGGDLKPCSINQSIALHPPSQSCLQITNRRHAAPQLWNFVNAFPRSVYIVSSWSPFSMRFVFVQSSTSTYRVGQIKWHHFTFLLVTHECIHKILSFLAHIK